MAAGRARWILVVSLVLASACAKTTPGGSAPGADLVDRRTVAVYTVAIRALVDTETWFDPVLIDERICLGAGDPSGEQIRCSRRFTEGEKRALLVELADLPNVRFVKNADAVTRRIFKGRIEGAGLIAVGPIEGSDDRVEVPGRSEAAVERSRYRHRAAAVHL